MSDEVRVPDPHADGLTVLLPAAAKRPRLIVCERDGHWAVALRRALAPEWGRILQTRSLPECWAELATRPASFVVVELTNENRDGLLDRLVRLQHKFPLARAAVVAERRLAQYEWLMREATAVHFECSPRRSDLVAQLAARHLAHAPVPTQSTTQRLWAGLPWRG